MTEPAYEFAAQLSKDKTIEEVWREGLERNPEEAPGQEEVIEILAQLNNAHLIQSDLPADSAQLFERDRLVYGEINNPSRLLARALLDPESEWQSKTVPPWWTRPTAC